MGAGFLGRNAKQPYSFGRWRWNSFLSTTCNGFLAVVDKRGLFRTFSIRRRITSNAPRVHFRIRLFLKINSCCKAIIIILIY
jgi:hypothetical protein